MPLLTGINTYGQNPVKFNKTVLHNEFVSEGVAVADVNNDGLTDILAGPFWFEAPDWEKHEIYEVQEFSFNKGYSNSMLNFTQDVNQDGWIDFVRIDFPGKGAYWHENPGNKKGHWNVNTIYETVGNESPTFVDVDGDGREDLVCGDPTNNQMIWLKSPSDKSDLKWKKYSISEEGVEGTRRFAHGLGFGDVNGDNFNDVFIRFGWWENPGDPKKPEWIFHEADLGQKCSHMYANDVDGDGDNDIVSASAHYSGFWWHEQITDGGKTKWVEHLISQTIAETHAVMSVDINGDGRKDFISGNRFYAHNSEDPEDHGPPVVSWYEYDPKRAPFPKWTEYPIDDDSGVGLNIVAEDITKDGLIDIAIANKKGVFFFEQKRREL